MKAFLLTLPLAFLLTACGSKVAKSQPKDLLAIVGERMITQVDLQAEMKRRSGLGQIVPPAKQVLDELVTREALVARALKLGIDRDDTVHRAWQNALIAELKNRELRPRLENATIPSETVRDSTIDSKRLPDQMHLAVLQLSLVRHATEQRDALLRARMNEAREKAVKLPTDERTFGALAVDYSDHQATRYLGGDAGWFDADLNNAALPSDVLRAAARLNAPGEMSPVIKTERGYYLVRLMERHSSGEPALASKDSGVRHRLLNEERKRLETEFISDARQKAGVRFFESAAAKTLLADSRGAEAHLPAIP